MFGSQPPPASHMISTVYRACSRGALGEQSIYSIHPMPDLSTLPRSTDALYLALLTLLPQNTTTHLIYQSILFFLTQIKFLFLGFEAFLLPLFILFHAYLMICSTQVPGDAIIPRFFVKFILIFRYADDFCLLLAILTFLLESI